MVVLILLQLNKAYKSYQNNTIIETETGLYFLQNTLNKLFSRIELDSKIADNL